MINFALAYIMNIKLLAPSVVWLKTYLIDNYGLETYDILCPLAFLSRSEWEQKLCSEFDVE